MTPVEDERATPAALERLLKLETERWGRIIKGCGYYPAIAPARRYISFTFLSGRLRIGLPVAAKMALSTAGATTQIVGSPTPPQKS